MFNKKVRLQKMKTLNEIEKFVITRFVPKEQPKETVFSKQPPYEYEIDLAPEPSDFEGKTVCTESSGTLVDIEQLREVAKSIKKELLGGLCKSNEHCEHCAGIQGTIEFINKFFNLGDKE
jgi:hypothetical protein